MPLTIKKISADLKDYGEQATLRKCDQLYQMTDFISEDYPQHRSWFYKKHIPQIFKPDKAVYRDIIYAEENEVPLGVSFIKADVEEKKICTLYVSDDARGKGVGKALIEASMDALGTTKPMITFADYKLPMFEPFIKKYDWELTQIVSGIYNDKYQEYVYNGILTM